MAGLLLVRDPDAERRARVLAAADPDLAPDGGPPRGEATCGDVSVRWAAPDALPRSVVATPHDLCLVLGEARARPHGPCAEAGALPAADAVDVPALGGWHLALAADAQGHVRIGVDPLGALPLVWWTEGEVLLAGTSAESFRHHPAFRPRLDPEGLVGLLLVNGLVGGRTLWAGVRRVAPGHLLVAPAGGAPRERPQVRLARAATARGRSAAAQMDQVESAIEVALASATPREEARTLLLSGGLDSRLLAEMLTAADRPPVAVTLGLPHDLDFLCARRVARRLGLEHHLRERTAEDDVRGAALDVRLLHLAAGFSLPGKWRFPRVLADLPARVVTGLALDALVGPYGWVALPRAGADHFDEVLAAIGAWGVPPDRLRRLLRREVFGDAVDDVLATLRRVHDETADEPFHRAWHLYLHHRQRFQVLSAGWSLAWSGPPVLPALDLGVLDAALAMPGEAIFDRRIEIGILARRHPALARLPLDRNGFDLRPPRPGPVSRVRWAIDRRVAPVRRLRRAWHRRHGEPRGFYRQADPAGPAWSRLRALAEPHRSRVEPLFRPEALTEMLPPPGAPWPARDPIAGSAGAKTLLGFLLWSEGRLG